MALSSSSLKSGIEAIGNKTTNAAAATAWAGAVVTYAAGVVPISTTVAGAKAALETALTAAFAERPSAAAKMEDAFTAFAKTVAGGMTGAGYKGTAPSGEVGFATVFASTTDNAGTAAQAIADAIHAWMITGSAKMLSSPFTVSNWA